uniref:CSON013278 protein n=1 Tax=Culicoides sonorensis TaxID=179676 RepID=A0A336MBU3_CULSO
MCIKRHIKKLGNRAKNIITIKKKESLKSKLINKLNISRSVHDITPTVLAPVVPYEISDQEVTTILKTSPSKESEESLEESITTSLQLSPEEYKEFIKKDREESLSELTSEKIFTVTDLNEASMKRSEEQLANINQNNNKSNNKKRSKKSPVQESSDSGLSTSVHVQEAQTPYQKQLSISKSNDLNEPETLEGSGEVTINKTGEISFRIGTPVRPPQTPTGISNITHITESVSIDSSKNPASLEEISSISSESQSPPLSENSRRKIKYIPQPTLETEEKEVFGPPSSVLSESYSIDYSLNPLSMAESQPEGQQGTQSGVTNLTMSSEKKEHLYKILVIGELEAVGAFIVFDVTRTSTFDAVIKWKQDLDSKVQLPDGSSIPCILLANKCDQPKQGIVTTPAKLDEYCKENGFSGWFETSAKENINIDDAAKALVNKILANDKVMNSHETEGDGFAIDGHDNGTKDFKRF